MHPSGHYLRTKGVYVFHTCLMEKNMGPSSASHSGSTDVTHCRRRGESSVGGVPRLGGREGGVRWSAPA